MTLNIPEKPTSCGPQLFFSESDLPPMRRLYTEDASFAEMRGGLESFDHKAEQTFLEEEVNLENHRDDTRRVCDVMQNMAFHFLMTGDEWARSGSSRD